MFVQNHLQVRMDLWCSAGQNLYGMEVSKKLRMAGLYSIIFPFDLERMI